MREALHEIRNHLAVAVAQVEAMRDGVLDATPERLGVVLAALEAVDALLHALPRDPGSDRKNS